MKRKICILTGTRAEYGLLKPVMLAIKKKSTLKLQLIVTGMHLLPEFGETIQDIKQDGFNIDEEVDMAANDDSLSAMAESVGKGIIGISKALKHLEPDILVVLGDRVEPLAAVITASIMKIPVAHLGGGQISGGIDNVIRNVITKFASLHFVRTPEHAEKIKNMGEEEWRIFTVGTFCLDTMLNVDLIPPKKIAEKYSLDLDEPILLVVFHSDTLDIEKSIQQAENLCKALISLDLQTVFIYPNADAGGRKILETIKKYSNYPKIKLYKNLSQVDYYSIMNVSSVMLGNSSSGIIEAPVIGLPVVNIGDRQKGRDRSNNVVDASGKKSEIVNIVKKILSDSDYHHKLSKCRGVFGEGNAGEKIVDVLSKIDISNRLIYKK